MRDDNETQPGLVDELQRLFTDALLRGDEGGAELVVREAIDAGLDEARIDEVVITPALRAVGDLWEAGELSIAQEHLATEIALRVVALQREVFRVVRRRSRAVVILSAVRGEQHVVGLRMAASLLAHAGYEIKQLGPDVPPAALGVAVELHRPAVVGLTATMPSAAIDVDAAIATVQAIRPGTGLVVGGNGVPARFLEQPGVRHCRRVTEAVDIVDGLAQRASLN
jgi:MerR family transcriptional regulator, light-induced transcriptional regulator